MAAILSSLIAGTVLGAGLAISQMMNPAKVIAFLDVGGDWDPTLAFVMVGAILAATPGFAAARRRAGPAFSAKFELPTRRDVDISLIFGAIIFGIGWGLAGYCPGPALAGLSAGMWPVFAFVASMVAGMLLYRLLPSR